jgi:GT2 family glycosyltransferase
VKDKGSVTNSGKICAVVVTYNRKTLLEECLKALQKQTRRLDEIIVIDNASTDGTEKLMKTRFADITYVKLPQNIGGSGGFHEGIKLAYEKGHDWIWVMDDDAIPVADALEKLISCSMIHQDKVYALASAVLNRDGSIHLNPRRLFDPETLLEAEISIDKYKQDYFQMDTASFVGLLISRKFVEVFGLPIKDFFIYYDDTEYSLRIQNLGIMITVPDSKIIHGAYRNASEELERRAARPDWDWKYYYFVRNRIYTYRKHGNVGFIMLMTWTLQMSRDIFNRHHSRFKNMKILLWATLDGLIGKLGKNNKFLPR